MFAPDVPLRAFQTSPDAFVLSDSTGRVQMVNDAAATLLECDPAQAAGQPCWAVVGLRTSDGAPLCGPHCEIRERLSGSAPCLKRRAVRVSRSGARCTIDLFTLQVRHDQNGGSWVLHMMTPADDARPTPSPHTMTSAQASRTTETLTRREAQILDAISTGSSTEGIADDLCISIVTVRNHVRSVLHKLGVHNRLEAVLVWNSRTR